MLLHHTLPCRNSGRWAQRQSADFFVGESRRKGYVARSAFKLLHMDDRFGLFEGRRTRAVIDLGCSPGGWLQVIRERTSDRCKLVGLDLLPTRAHIPGAQLMQGDFRDTVARQRVLEALGSSTSGSNSEEAHAPLVDVVTSDMCPNRSGQYEDRQRLASLGNEALLFSIPLLRVGGHFVCKVLGDKGTYAELHALAEQHFLRVHICKPPASRSDSDETFLVAHSKLKDPRRRTGPGSRYGLDDWPGFSRTNHRRPSRGSPR